MKSLFSKVIKLLCSIPKDWYQHFALGVLIAFLSAITFSWTPVWCMEVVSILFTGVVATGKELWDEVINWWDILTTVCGGLIVWILLLL